MMDDLDILRRKAAAFDAIEQCVLNLSRHPANTRVSRVGVATSLPARWQIILHENEAFDWPPPVAPLLEAIEARMSIERQTPKSTIGKDAT